MTGPLDGFLFGLASSLHCLAMCGPLAAVGGRVPAQAAAYHGARVAAYALVAGTLAALGGALGLGTVVASGGVPWVSLVLGAGLLAGALGGERLLQPIPGLGGLVRAVLARGRSLPAVARCGLIGAATPLLPCGVLYALWAAAVLSGDFAAGSLLGAAFAAGSLPLLLVAQLQVGALTRRLGPQAAAWLRRGAMLAAAGLLLWRGLAGTAGTPVCCG